jgi:hypothetical protein
MLDERRRHDNGHREGRGGGRIIEASVFAYSRVICRLARPAQRLDKLVLLRLGCRGLMRK